MKPLICWIMAATAPFILADTDHHRLKRQISDKDLLFREICAIGDYTFRHPFSCSTYLMCDKGVYTELECPGNMIYDVKMKACNFRRLVKCKMIDGMADFGDNPYDVDLDANTTMSSTIPMQMQHG